MVALRLTKEGFGTMEQILAMPADLVLDALEYVNFLADYQEAQNQINREKT